MAVSVPCEPAVSVKPASSVGRTLSVTRARAAFAEWKPIGGFTIRRTRRLRPSCCAEFRPGRMAAGARRPALCESDRLRQGDKGLDELQTLEKNRANGLGEPVARTISPMTREHVFPPFRTLGGECATYATHIRSPRS